jgi:hypothetical protein
MGQQTGLTSIPITSVCLALPFFRSTEWPSFAARNQEHTFYIP